MAPNVRWRYGKAYKAMNALGYSTEIVKPILKKLLDVYEKNWDLIEEQNYSVLLDSILDSEDKMGSLEQKDDEELIRWLGNVRAEDEHEFLDYSLEMLSDDEDDQVQDTMPVNSNTVERKLKSECNDDDAPHTFHSAAMESVNEPLFDDHPDDSSNGYFLEFPDSEDLYSEEKQNGKSDSDSRLDIASLPGSEKVKISLIYDKSSLPLDFCAPSLESVVEMVQKECIESYGITQPGFSFLRLMEFTCECFLAVSGAICEVKTNLRAKQNQEPIKSGYTFSIAPDFLNLMKVKPSLPVVPCSNMLETVFIKKDMKRKRSCKTIVAWKQRPSHKPFYFVEDISKGEEEVKISLVNEFNHERPPAFVYIPKNVVFQEARIRFLLARISDDDCCSGCIGECLALKIPCACAGETTGEFAYTRQNLLKDNFLENFVSMNREPKKHPHVYCQDCPLERSNGSERLSGKCKGHLVRKFIKECWHKCGCSKNCGNRVVQRGISVNLQVFMTPDGKGWGVRALENLPKGTFVCEYVGEIVTNMELYERNANSANERHTYPVLLDADWTSERVLNDEETLCLDATHYGNVARFLNHRCFDTNLVEIPVEVETPDHHYYHLAFFTTRNVNALEELVWDYGIDYDDHNHPVKAFKCQCGSKLCRDVKPRKRVRSSY
ncbi:hypothetical protein DM860_002325 [Cuscuta australis]|uniref:SET domain-containing protein n=1 Tax=Cuscuta australis TaxID=267555 RepID=A0A328CXZ3_9ASTE|nr:hypothetical protein DM860_002325 [Cuscuta australis]